MFNIAVNIESIANVKVQRRTIDIKSLQFNKQRFKRRILYDKVLIQAITI